MKDFIIKCVLITVCLIILGSFISSWIPKYEFIDADTRCNKMTGKVERYSTRSWDQGWH